MSHINEEIILSGVILNESVTVTLTEIIHIYHVDQEFCTSLIEYGLIEPIQNQRELSFDGRALKQIETALRLKEDLELNIPGIVLTLELLQELQDKENELTMLRKHIEKNE